MPNKTNRKSPKRRNSKKIAKTRRSSNKRALAMRGGAVTGLSPAAPFIGAPYNAGDLVPSGNYYPLSASGIPVGGIDPARQSNEILAMQKGGKAMGRGGKGPMGRGGKGPMGRGGKGRKTKKGGCWFWEDKPQKRRSLRKSNKRTARQRTARQRTARQRGGGLSNYFSTILPEDVLNAGRAVPAAFGHLADRFNGLISSPSSMVYPTQQPLVASVQTTNAITPPDIKAIYTSAANTVNSI
jgi:hypothetical protein